VVAHNVVHGGLGQYGTIVARNGPLDIEDNVISGSQGSGIGLVGSVGSRVERNTVYANRGSGVSIYSEVVVGVYTIVRNRIYANGGDGIHAEGDVSEQVSNNRIFRNAGSGVHVDYTGWDNPDSTGVSGSAHRYLRNLVYLNGGAGIEAANYRSPLVLRGNSADRNGADGIHVGAGTIHDENPSWSPDGRHIAFQSDRAGSEDLFVANSDGAGVRRLTTDPAADTNPQWSPDGSTIAFESAQRGAIGLYTINPDGSGLHKLADLGPEDPGFSWSPDGKRIAFGGDFLYVVNADGTGLRQVSDLPSAADPTWSPNGTQVAFQQTRTMPDSTFEAQWLIVVNVDSSDTTPFSTFPGNIDPSWSPDGTKIALNGITTVNADGSDLPFGTDLTPGRHPQWSPDGKQLTFESDRGARLTDVFVANSNGSGRTNVTNSALYAETRPVWSPDGSRIAYNVSGPGIDEVDMIRPDGSGRTSIVNDFPATITANSADRNHALGIDVVPGVADGGGNSARQNGDPRQCLGIECRP
jgi:TolB protein